MKLSVDRIDTYNECCCSDQSTASSSFCFKDDLQKPTKSHSANDLVDLAKSRPRLSLLFVSVVVGCLLINSVYIPLPERWASRNIMTVIGLVLRTTYAQPVNFLSRFGPIHQVLYTRFILDFYARLLSGCNLKDNDLKIYDTQIAGVSVRVYDQIARRDNDGLIVFIHGGGFVLGEVAGYDNLVRDIARKSKMTVISIEYHRAPEHRFPTQILECEAVITSLLSHSHRIFKINPEKIILTGDSAGGNLVAVMSQRFARQRRRGSTLPPLCAQILFYPLLQFIDLRTPSYQQYYNEYGSAGFLDPRAIARILLVYIGANLDVEFVDHIVNNRHSGYQVLEAYSERLSHNLLPKSYSSDLPYYSYTRDWHTGSPDQAAFEHLFGTHNITSPDIMPLLGELDDLPPAFVITCEFDVLRDEGFFYAHALRQAGNVVEYKMYEGAFHAILNLENLPLAQRIVSDAVNFAQKHARAQSF